MRSKTGLWIVFLFTGLFIIGSSGFDAYAAKKVKLGLTSAAAPGTTTELAADRFKELVEKQSNGDIEIVRYAAGELYKDKQAYPAVADGTVQMGMLSGPVAGMRSKPLEFICSFGAQGLWTSKEHYRRFIDNPEVRKIASEEFAKKYNSKLLGIVAYGNSVVGARRPIHTIADYKNLKMRTIGGGQATLYKSLGAIPTELSSSEIYMGLQRGLIDGATTGPARFLKSKLYEVTPYITQDYTLPELSFFLVINMGAWKALSPEHQRIFEKAGADVVTWSRNFTVKETEKSYKELEGKKEVKEVFFLPKEERAKLVNIVTPPMKKYVEKRIGKEKGEELLQLLDAAK